MSVTNCGIQRHAGKRGHECPAVYVKQRECSDPDGTEKLPGKWYLLSTYHFNVWDAVF